MVHNLVVFGAETIHGVNLFGYAFLHLVDGHGLCPAEAFGEDAVYCRSYGALLRGEAGVAAGEGKSVVLALYWA